jgi:hypothetical protein
LFLFLLFTIFSLLDLSKSGSGENEVEKNFISKLKDQFGNQFTSHYEGYIFLFLFYFIYELSLKGMLNDYVSANETLGHFSNYCENKHISLPFKYVSVFTIN